MSALPPIAGIDQQFENVRHVIAVSAAAAPPRSATSLRDVRFTPIADILGRSRNVG
jgi:hypothetical protein